MRRAGELQVREPGVGGEADHAAHRRGKAGQFKLHVGLDVLGPLGQAGQPEGPDVDAGQQVLAEGGPPRLSGREVAVGAADEVEVADHLAVSAHGQEAAVLDGAQQHGLFIGAELTDLIEEEHAAVGRFEQTGAIGGGAGEGALAVAEQGRHGLIAPQCGAVEFHQRAADQVAGLAQFVDAAGELALAGAGGAEQQDGLAGGFGDQFDLLEQAAHAPVGGADARGQAGEGLLVAAFQPAGEAVVGAEVEIDHAERAGLVGAAVVRRGPLHQFAGDDAALHQEEQADLGDVGARGHVDQILGVGGEAEAVGEVGQGGVDLGEVPRVLQGHDVAHDLGLGGDLADVGHQHIGDGLGTGGLDEFQTVDPQIGLLDQGEGGPPSLPALGPGLSRAVGVQDGSNHADGDGLGHSFKDTPIYLSIFFTDYSPSAAPPGPTQAGLTPGTRCAMVMCRPPHPAGAV